jgi:hypothetical protein
MEKRAERLAAASALILEGRTMTPFVESAIIKGRQSAQGNSLQLSSPTQGRVIQPDGCIFLVDIAAGTCSCCKYHKGCHLSNTTDRAGDYSFPAYYIIPFKLGGDLR